LKSFERGGNKEVVSETVKLPVLFSLFTGGDLATSRYAVNGLLELRSKINTTPGIDQTIIGGLLTKWVAEDFSPLSGVALSPRTLPVVAFINSSRASDVGRVLIDLDVELRRTLAFISDRRMRPYPDRGTVEILSAKRGSVTNVLFKLAPLFFSALSTEPLEFLLALSWFWDHRMNQTRTRPARSLQDHFTAFSAIIESAKRSITSKESVMIALKIKTKGSTEFCLESKKVCLSKVVELESGRSSD
jgi:hypothetical protein